MSKAQQLRISDYLDFAKVVKLQLSKEILLQVLKFAKVL